MVAGGKYTDMFFDSIAAAGGGIADTPGGRPGKGRSGGFGVLSLLAQAGYALYRGKTKLAAVLVGAAAIATRWSKVSYVVNVALTLYRLLRRLR